jgi:hypothetical protein
MPVNNPVKIKTKKVSERQLARKAVIAERKLDRIKARKAAKSQRKQIDKQRAKIFNESMTFWFNTVRKNCNAKNLRL